MFKRKKKLFTNDTLKNSVDIKKLVESGFVRWYNVKTKHLNPRRTRTRFGEAGHGK